MNWLFTKKRVISKDLHKAAIQLEKINEYYESVKTSNATIQAGIGNDIKEYFDNLTKVQMAIEYFASNNNQQMKAQNEELWLQGRRIVEREFDLILEKSTCMGITEKIIFDPKSLNSEELFEVVNENFESKSQTKSFFRFWQILSEWREKNTNDNRLVQRSRTISCWGPAWEDLSQSCRLDFELYQ